MTTGGDSTHLPLRSRRQFCGTEKGSRRAGIATRVAGAEGPATIQVRNTSTTRKGTVSMEIIWEDPPEEALQRPTRYAPLIKALRENPGKWARIPGERTEATAKGLRQNIQSGRLPGWGAKGDHEAVVQGSAVWVRYVAPTKPSESVTGAPEAAPEPVEAQAPAEDEDTVAETPAAPMIRAWARSQGIVIADHGRLPRKLVERYHNRHAYPH